MKIIVAHAILNASIPLTIDNHFFSATLFYRSLVHTIAEKEHAMFQQMSVPPNLWAQADVINISAEALKAKIATLQKDCSHQKEKVIEWDSNYSPRVDGQGKGAEVIKGYRCRTCAKFEPFVGQPYDRCWLCGGKMMYAGITFCGEDRVHVSRCQDCGKEYDTT